MTRLCFSSLLEEYAAAWLHQRLTQLRHLKTIAAFVEWFGSENFAAVDASVMMSWVRDRLTVASASETAVELYRLCRFLDFLFQCGHIGEHPLGSGGHSPQMCMRRVRMVQGAAEADASTLAKRLPALGRKKYRSCLGDAIHDFVAHRRGLGYHQTRSLLARLDWFDRFAAECGLARPADIDGALLRRFAVHLRQINNPSRGHIMAAVGGFIRFLARGGTVSAAPMNSLPRMRNLPRYYPVVPTLKQIEQLLARIDAYRRRPRCEFRGWTYRTMIHLAYACGLRNGEVRRLRLQDVDPLQQTLFIDQTKFGKQRLIPVGPGMCAALQSYIEERTRRCPPRSSADPLFIALPDGKAYGTMSLTRLFPRFWLEAGLQGVDGRRPRFHDLRHAFAVHRLEKWYQEGADVWHRMYLLSVYMGHSDVKHTQVYLHLSPHLLRLAAHQLAESVAPALQWHSDAEA